VAPIPSPEKDRVKKMRKYAKISELKLGVNFGAWEKFQTWKLALKLNF